MPADGMTQRVRQSAGSATPLRPTSTRGRIGMMSGLGPTLPTLAMQQLDGYLRQTGRDAARWREGIHRPAELRRLYDKLTFASTNVVAFIPVPVLASPAVRTKRGSSLPSIAGRGRSERPPHEPNSNP